MFVGAKVDIGYSVARALVSRQVFRWMGVTLCADDRIDRRL